MADKPVSCPKCGCQVFKVDQLSYSSQDYNAVTGDWSLDYNHGYEVDFPQAATCKECGTDVTDLLNTDTIQFYGVPPEREPVEDDEDDEGCPKGDPDCLSRADECHDACEGRPNPFGVCGNCGELVNFEEHDRDACGRGRKSVRS